MEVKNLHIREHPPENLDIFTPFFLRRLVLKWLFGVIDGLHDPWASGLERRGVAAFRKGNVLGGFCEKAVRIRCSPRDPLCNVNHGKPSH